MRKRKEKKIVCSSLATVIIVGLCWCSPLNAAVKDQSRVPDFPNNSTPKPPDNLFLPDDLYEKPPHRIAPQTPQPRIKEEDTVPAGPFEINDIPALIKMQLTTEVAKRALDAFADVGSKYDDKGLTDYPTLKEFVEKTDAGKRLEAEVQKHGFKDIVEWNTAIMNVSFAFGSLIEDQEADIRAQIANVKADKSLSDKKKRRIVASLNALIPSKENVEIIRQLQKVPEYEKKLNLLDAFE